jgi:hypothetical protein
MRKLSGLMSRWMKLFEWMYSTRSSTWSAIISVVCSVKCRPQRLNKSSREYPRRSITSTLYEPSTPYQRM